MQHDRDAEARSALAEVYALLRALGRQKAFDAEDQSAPSVGSSERIEGARGVPTCPS